MGEHQEKLHQGRPSIPKKRALLGKMPTMHSMKKVLKEKDLQFPRTKVVSDSYRFLEWKGWGKLHANRSGLAYIPGVTRKRGTR